MHNSKEEEFQLEFVRFMTWTFFIGMYLYMLGSATLAAFHAEWNLSAGWLMLTAMISAGVGYMRYDDGEWPWVIS